MNQDLMDFFSKNNLPNKIKGGAYIMNMTIKNMKMTLMNINKTLMNMKMLLHIGLLCVAKILKLFILTVLQLNILLQKL